MDIVVSIFQPMCWQLAVNWPDFLHNGEERQLGWMSIDYVNRMNGARRRNTEKNFYWVAQLSKISLSLVKIWAARAKNRISFRITIKKKEKWQQQQQTKRAREIVEIVQKSVKWACYPWKKINTITLLSFVWGKNRKHTNTRILPSIPNCSCSLVCRERRRRRRPTNCDDTFNQLKAGVYGRGHCWRWEFQMSVKIE